MTRQRQIIFSYLQKTEGYPTAEKVLIAVRKQLPNISLGTVYRTLEFLQANGFIKKVDTGRISHYSAKVEVCGHFICQDCDKVIALPQVQSKSLSAATKLHVSKIGQPRIIQLNVFGHCHHCLPKK